MKLYHATTTKRASGILEKGFRGGRVWGHEDVVFFADTPLPDFGDMSGSSWIVIDATRALLTFDQYEESERAYDQAQYAARCFCLPVAAVNKCERWEEQGY